MAAATEICTGLLRIVGSGRKAHLQQLWHIHEGGLVSEEWRDVPTVPDDEDHADHSAPVDENAKSDET
jgi:hypothetical protein